MDGGEHPAPGQPENKSAQRLLVADDLEVFRATEGSTEISLIEYSYRTLLPGAQQYYSRYV